MVGVQAEAVKRLGVICHSNLKSGQFKAEKWTPLVASRKPTGGTYGADPQAVHG